ncbi:putative leucine-rich repeat receptor-like serine/threonine-protein kinase At2g24130 [Prunus persica]|uniref:putative leucine-rich repeat receptor-like serine/threonine-protein kinase At2g24130 n=1 Tax=Prunus persica TaxID=3760 RepID=UPI0009AB9E07|nr:putative leucine-rich repeat receptor-like serine/threonine-protein kinase At2g24130 [Prunus persica]
MVEARCCFKLLYAIVVVLLLHMSSPCIGCSERDRQALLAFKQGLVGDDGDRLLSWGREAQNKNCCQWEGVYCSSNQTGHVVKLDLEDQSLRGKISPELVKLQHLEYLDLSFNNFSGSKIPDFIGSLSNLRHLDLSSANFGGQIPNQLGNLTHLQYLDLSSYGYGGIRTVNSIHAKNLNWLPNISGLKHLDLSFTNLSDVVGWLEAVNMLPKLRKLILSACKLPPPIISSVSLMNSSNSLVHVDLSSNNLNSSIFQWLSGTHTNLVYLDLSWNKFRGSSIPASFGNMSSLAHLSLHRSQLEGGIPNSFAKLCRLRELDLWGNSLTGQLSDFVETLSKCAQKTLESLDISHNHDISGSLPDLTNFLSLKSLFLEKNNLSGRIPENIGQMSKLETIGFGWNSLEGF